MSLSPLSILPIVAVLAFAPDARAEVPVEVTRALSRALTIEGGKVVPVNFAAPSHCRIREAQVTQPLTGSGRVAVKYAGNGCSGFAWVDVQVWADVAITTRFVARGESLGGALTRASREIRRGQAVYWPATSAVASRPLPAGTILSQRDVGATFDTAGGVVRVLVVSGALAVATQGRRIACGAGRYCAVLNSGKRVEGVLDDEQRLVVELP